MTEERITIHDCRQVGHCVAGVRKWFHAHDLDFRQFMREGIDAQTFIARGDGLSLQIVEAKRAREGR
jgi:hypothetical protein